MKRLLHLHRNCARATTGPSFTVSKRILHGGKQEGVELIEIDNGMMTITVIPTRGMGIFKVQSGDVTLGWASPVKEIVHPAFIELESRGGLGWLDGFNEMLVRCGYEWTGHPGMDDGRLLSLHGRAVNTPASKVVAVIDEEPPHRIRVRGQVNEKVFKFVNHETWTEVSTEPGSQSFEINDTLTNRADYEHEYQIIYHGNFGPPLLEEGSEFVAPVKTVAPFNDDAAKDIDTWTTYLGPTKNYGEQVYNVIPYAGADGWTTVMLPKMAPAVSSSNMTPGRFPTSACGRTPTRRRKDMSPAWSLEPDMPMRARSRGKAAASRKFRPESRARSV